jgi:F-type H+-transporting ATPase subunit a
MAEGHHAAKHVQSVFAGESGTWLEPIGRALGLCHPVDPQHPQGHWVHNDWLVVAFFIIALVSLVVFLGTRKRDLVPRGWQNLLEMIVEIFRGFCRRIIGEGGEKYAPIVGTYFILIFLLNLIGLFPGMVSPTANTNTTLALALSAFVITVYIAIRENGFIGFIDHLAGSPSKQPWFMWWLPILMLPIETISLFARPISLCFRLLGNIFGEDMVIHKLAEMGSKIFYIPVQFPLMVLGLFTSGVQALVFSMLVAIYISLGLPHREHGHEREHEHALERAAAHPTTHG